MKISKIKFRTYRYVEKGTSESYWKNVILSHTPINRLGKRSQDILIVFRINMHQRERVDYSHRLRNSAEIFAQENRKTKQGLQ